MKKSTFRLMMSMAVTLGLVASSHASQIIYVNQNAPSNSQTNGTSWANAYRELRDALNNPNLNPTADNPVEIWVAKGTYTPVPPSSSERFAAFGLKSHLRILGGFAGNEVFDTQRLFFGNVTVLSGDIYYLQGNAITAQNAQSTPVPLTPSDRSLQDNCFNVVVGYHVTDVVLDQLTIANGCAFNTNNVSEDYVASMVMPLDDTNTLSGLTIAPLDRTVAGGGLYFEGEHDRDPNSVDLALNNCTFMNNVSMGYGGGMAIKEANVQAAFCTFQNNLAAEEGGAAFFQSCMYNIEACNFQGNTSEGSGGAIQVQTICSDKTLPPLAKSDFKSFQDEFGVSPTDFKKYASLSMKGLKLTKNLVTSFSKAYEAESGALNVFKATVKNALPKNPAASTVQNAETGAEEEMSATGRATAAYAAVTAVVSAVDLGLQIAELAGADTNNAFVRGWTVFDENFQKWATPGGYAKQLAEIMESHLKSAIDDTEFYKDAWNIRQFQLSVYNQQSPSIVLFCKFNNNFAGTSGGAVDCCHDNVQFEGCSFTGNSCSDDGGAMCLNTWTTPKIVSCTFYQNVCTNGQSAMANIGHSRAQIINSTFYQNHSLSTNGYAVGSELGSEIEVLNCILWGNTKSTNYTVGADLFASTKASLANNTNTLAQYNNAGPAYIDWIGLCDVSYSCVQSLHQIPLGTDHMPLFTEDATYTGAQIDDVVAALKLGEDSGTLEYYGFLNIGEGIRPTLLNSSKHNIDSDPQLDSNMVPAAFSPVIDAGNNKAIDNNSNQSFTDHDVQQGNRFVGASIDMGAVETQTKFGRAATIYVRTTATGNGSGSDWNDAMGNLQAAISAAGAHQVWVAAGTYYPTNNSDRTASFNMGDQVVVYGGFSGSETNLDQRNWQAHPTILSGDIGTRGDDSDNSYHVIFNRSIDDRALLDGFYITKGRAQGSGPDVVGAAIYNDNATPTIQNCVFLDNVANDRGGAIYSVGTEGSPINFCQFSNNVAGTSGGAIYYDQSRLWMKECIFAKNSSVTGGALTMNYTDYAYIYNTLFVSNSVSGSAAAGGGIESVYANISLYNCTFAENTVTASSSRGGGAVDFARLTRPTGSMQNCIFWHNSATNTAAVSPTLEYQQISFGSNAVPYVDHCLVEGLDVLTGLDANQNVDVDPQFLNLSAGNFHLAAFSPAVDGGVDRTGYGYPVVDLDGSNRLANVTMDLGAYEFQGKPIKASYKLSIARSCDDTGAVYSLTLTGTNAPGTSYQWQVNKNDGAGWSNISEGGVYFGTTTTNLGIVHPAVTMNGYRYRLSINSQGVIFTSTTGTIQVSRTLFYVRSNAHGANDGSTWYNAYTNLQTALSAAASCSQIWVAAGTYTPGSYGFYMKPDVAIYGGFNGTETSLSQRNWRTNISILSGNSAGLAQPIVSAIDHRVDASTIFDGFTLSGATNGAMRISACSPVVRNCTFMNNFGQSGGALSIDDGAIPLVVNCVFANNTCSSEGGALNCSYSAPQFFDCLFYGNVSTFRAGAIATVQSTLQLVSCTVAGNSAQSSGGGLYQFGGTNQIINSIFWGNQDGKILGTLASKQNYIDNYPGWIGVQNIQNSDMQGATNGLAYDPLFVDTSIHDYHLSATSPLIGAGNNAYTNGLTTDIGGNPRVVGSAIDIGAYEYQGTPSSPLYLLAVPQSVTLCDPSEAAMFTVQGTNSGNDFQWQVNSGSGFASVPVNSSYVVSVSGGTSTLTVSNLSGMNGYQFRAVVTATGTVTPAATLTLNSPTIIYVNAAHSGGSYNGSSWANAFVDLQSALSAADTCSEIWVARGTYTPVNIAGVSSYQLKSGVGIYGGFAGTETNRAARNWMVNPTVLVGNTNVTAIIGNTVTSGGVIDATAVIDGFTFSNATGTAALRNLYANPTIRNCFFTANSGFSILNESSSPVISSCTFSNNSGVPVYNRSSSPTITGCNFTHNTVANLTGGIYMQGGNVLVNACTFDGNSGGAGGALFNSESAISIVTACRFLNNTSGAGGAINNFPSSSMTLQNCLFSGNTVPSFDGGAIIHYGASMLIESCTIANNYALVSGAGVYNQGDNLVIKNSILWGNSVGGSGTFSGNADLVQIDTSPEKAPATVLSSDVQGLATYAGHGNIGYDPLFANASGGDFTLTSYSPAIDAGTNDTDVATTDLVGNPRVYGGKVDLGAYERQSSGAGVLNFVSSPVTAQSSCVGSSIQFSVSGSSTNSYTYQWQQLVGTNFVNVGANFTATNSGNSSTLQAANLSLSESGTILRFIVVGTSYASSNLTLTVTPPRVVYVNAANAAGGDGTSWVNAFQSVQDAIDNADSCSEVWVAGGNYYLTNSAGVGYTVQMKSGVPVYGGFAGNESQLNVRNAALHPTILHAASTLPAIYNEGIYTPIDSSALLDGFTIFGANAWAVQNYTASPTFQNCTFVNTISGGVNNSERAAPLFINCLFSNCVAGAMQSIPRSSPTVTNCVFINNGSTFRGAAIFNAYGDIQIIDCRFTNNMCRGVGGSAVVQEGSGTMTATRSIFSGNLSGALDVSAASATLTDCLLVDNFSDSGGAASVGLGSLTMNNCTVVRNAATYPSGGVYINQGRFTATNSIFWFNSNGNGGAPSGPVELQQVSGVNQSIVTLANCSVQGLSQYAGNNNTSYDPLFVNMSTDDFSLSTVSPLLNAGDNTATTLSSLDLAGNARVVATTVDIGAYEQQSTSQSPLLLVAEPSAQTTCSSNSATFSVVGASSSTLSVTWQVNSGSGFSDVVASSHYVISSNTYSSTLVVSNADSSLNGEQFRYVVGAGAFTSVPVTLTVTPRSVIYVNAANSNPTQTGASWSTALTNLQTALSMADTCSEIWVAAGTYTPTLLHSYSYELLPGVQIYGGFAGTETSRAQRDCIAHPTILLGNSQAPVVEGRYYNNNVNYSPIDRTTVLDGFTIQGIGVKSGIQFSEVSPTIRNCTFARNDGYTFDITGGSPLIDNCTFVSNTICCLSLLNGASPLVSNCVFTNNAAARGNVSIVSGSSATFTNCQFINNTDGTGIGCSYQSSFTAVNCKFTGNRASEATAIDLGNSTGTLVNCLIANNTSTYNAAGIDSAYSLLQLINCTVSRNIAGEAGGGINSYNSTNIILNSILWNNLDSDLEATVSGQQLRLERTNELVFMTNSCLEGLTNSANGNMGYNPLFMDDANGDFHLNANSPAVNTGSNAFITNYSVDLAGNSRIQLTNVDMGCYESATSSTPVYLQGSPGSQSHCPGDLVTFTIPVSNPSSLQWYFKWNGEWRAFSVNGNQLSPNGLLLGSYSRVNTSTNTSLVISNVVAGMNGYQFQLFTSDAAPVAASTPVSLFVNSAATIYVNAAALPGGDGTSWATAYNNLQAALAQVGACRPTIWVAKGTYYPTTGTNRSISFAMVPNTSLIGGFAGTETNINQRNIQVNPTILSGDIGAPDVSTDNSFCVLAAYGAMDTNTIVDGFTIQGATTVGVSLTGCSPTVQNCIIRSNGGNGMAFYSGSRSFVQYCTFTGNIGSGAVSIEFSSPLIENCVFSANVATNYGAGALYVVEGNPEIADCLIVGNKAANGGGIYFTRATTNGTMTVDVVNCTISGNLSTSSSGGGIYGAGGSIKLSNTILWGNASSGTSVLTSQYDGGRTTASFTFDRSCVQGSSETADNLDTAAGSDPMFISPLPASSAPFVGGDFHLQPCSPYVNSGDYNTEFMAIARDLDGLPRFHSGFAPDGGCYQTQTTPPHSLLILTQPVSITNCSSVVSSFQVYTPDNGVTYQWEADFGDGRGYVSLVDGGLFAGTTSSTLSVSNTTYAMNATLYRCVVSSSAGCFVPSLPATLTVRPSRLYVNAAAPAGGNGLSWNTAFRMVSQATGALIDSCNGEIWVAAGTYYDGSMVIPSHLSIYGGFNGTETQVYQRNWKLNPTIISGSGFSRTILFSLNGHTVDNSTRIDGFILEDTGTGIYNANGAGPTIANCVFRNISGNAIMNFSSGVYADPNPLIQDCLFVNNGSTNSNEQGSCIYNSGRSPLVQRCQFRGNIANTGGAIICWDQSYPTIQNCLFSGNKATSNGGAIAGEGNTFISIANCTFVGNSAQLGSAIMATVMSATNSIFWGNVDTAAISPTPTGVYEYGAAGVPGGRNDVSGLTFFHKGDISSDPLFVQGINAADAPTTNGDFHVSACSPTIDVGLNAGVSATDLDANTRILNGTVDMGAYENTDIHLAVTTPADQSAAIGAIAQFSVEANMPNCTFHWEVNKGSGFTSLADNSNYSGTTTDTLTVTNITVVLNNYKFRCRVQNAIGCTAYSAAATFHFIPGAGSPTVTGSQAVAMGEGNTNTIATYHATSPDGLAMTWSVAGEDSAFFRIGSGGALSFATVTDFTAPGDANQDNVYNVSVVSTDTAGHAGALIVSVTIVPSRVHFLTPPITNALEDSLYEYQFAAVGPTNITYSAPTLPSWLNFGTNVFLVSTFSGNGNYGTDDGAPTNATFSFPQNGVIDNAGNLMMADYGVNGLRQIAPDGTVTTVAQDLGYPVDVSQDAAGNIFTAGLDGGISKLSTDGTVTYIGGDGNIQTLAVDKTGTNIYYTKWNAHGIFRYRDDTGVTRFAGNEFEGGYVDDTGENARFNRPQKMAVDGAGNIYVADAFNHAIRMITPAGVVTTLAGNGSYGSSDDVGTSASFGYPYGLALDAIGNVYVADQGNYNIRKIALNKRVTTVAGSGVLGNTDGLAPFATFSYLYGVAVNNAGTMMYAIDVGNDNVRKLAGVPQVLYGTPRGADVGNADVVLHAVSGASSTNQSFTIAVQHVNHPPTADDQSLSVLHDTSLSITLTGSDQDPNDPANYHVVTPPAYGILSGDVPNLVYTPAPGYFGQDSFTYARNDGVVDSATATVSIDVLQYYPLTVTVYDAYRLYGESNPDSFGLVDLEGLQPGDEDITATYGTDATESSNVGYYNMYPVFNDPDGKLTNYIIITNYLGRLQVDYNRVVVIPDDKYIHAGDPTPVLTATLLNALPSDNLSAGLRLTPTRPNTPAGLATVKNYSIDFAYLSDPNNRMINYYLSAVSGTLHVIKPLVVTKAPTMLPGTKEPEHTTVTMSVTPTGTPPFSYQWFHDGVLVGTDATNIIADALVADSGAYHCVVSDLTGSGIATPDTTLTITNDVVIPTVSILFPKSRAETTTGDLAVSGTARDNARMVAVSTKLNNGDWTGVDTFFPITKAGNVLSANWTNNAISAASPDILVGTNWFHAMSYDASGQTSKVMSNVFFYDVASTLDLEITNVTTSVIDNTNALKPEMITTNLTTVAPPNPTSPTVMVGVTNGASLWVNRGPYTVVAVPGANQVFSNWTAAWDGQAETIVSTNPRYVFTMRTNLVLKANIIHNPYVEAAGQYNGLFMDETTNFSRSGFVTIAVDKSQGISGVLSFDGDDVTFSGKLPLSGITNGMAVSRVKFGKSNITLDLAMHFAVLDSGMRTNHITGVVHIDDSAVVLVADQSNQTTNYNGALMTAVMSEDTEDVTTVPGNYGWAQISIAAGKTPVFRASVSDGASLMPKVASVTQYGLYPFFSKLYAAKAVTNALTTNVVVAENLGSVIGWLQFNSTNTVSGDLVWTKTANTNANTNGIAKPYTNNYFNGFAQLLHLNGEAFMPPATATSGNAFGTVPLIGSVTLANGDLLSAQTANLTLDALNKVKMTSTNAVLGSKLTVLFDPKMGGFSGSYMNGVVRVPFTGVVLQSQKKAYGFFDGTLTSGSVTFDGNQ